MAVGDSSICNGIEYNAYTLAYINFDAEWTRASYDHPGGFWAATNQIKERVRNICRDYEDHVLENSYACGFGDKDKAKENAAFQDGLFIPVFHYPFGHSDISCVALFDDFDPIHQLSSRCETSVEELCVGFCPSMVSLRDSCDLRKALSEYHANFLSIDNIDTAMASIRDCFCEPHEHYAAWRNADATKGPGSNPRNERGADPAENSFLLMSRFKLNAMASLSLGSELMEHIFKLFIIKAAQALSCAFSKNSKVEEALRGFDVDPASISNFRMSILEMQGQEELAVMFTCDNMVLPAMVLSHMETTVFGDLFEIPSSGPSLQRKMDGQEWFLKLVDYDDGDEGVDISKCHLFSWLRSRASASKEWLQNPTNSENERPRGVVHAISDFRVLPGHLYNAEQTLERVQEKWGTGALDETDSCQKHHMHYLGTREMLARFVDEKVRPLPSMEPVADFLHKANALYETLGKQHQDVNGGRDFLAMHLKLGIPFPRIIDESGDKPTDLLCKEPEVHSAIIEKQLPIIWRRVVGSGRMGPPFKREGADYSGGGLLDMEMLHRCLKRLQVPISLRRTIEYLFQNYCSYLKNPLVFSTVCLDLYDVILALHRVITRDLIRANKIGDSECRPVDREQVEQLARLVGAIQRTLHHHLYRAFAEESNLDMEIDFRGGLNQILNAVDAVLKVAVGITRDHLLTDREGDRAGYDRIGVVSRVDFSPGIKVFPISLGLGRDRRLAYVNMDVPHALHLSSYIDLLHESFHLLYREIRSPWRTLSSEDRRGSCNMFLPTVKHYTDFDEVLEEIFVNALSMLLVCRNDPTMLIKHVLVEYNSTNRASGRHQGESRQKIVWMLLNAYMTVEGIAKFANEHSAKYPWLTEKIRQPKTVYELVDELWKLVSDLYSGSEEEFRESIRSQEEAAFSRYRNYVDMVVEKAFEVCDGYWKPAARKYLGVARGSALSEEEMAEAFEGLLRVEGEIKESLKVKSRMSEGGKKYWATSMSWCGIDDILKNLSNNSSSHLDTGLFACWIFSKILKLRTERIDELLALSESRLPRNHKIGRINSEALEKIRSDSGREKISSLIDPQSISLFTASPDARRQRLLLQISVLTSLRDLSSYQRGKRFRDLLERTKKFDANGCKFTIPPKWIVENDGGKTGRITIMLMDRSGDGSVMNLLGKIFIETSSADKPKPQVDGLVYHSKRCHVGYDISVYRKKDMESAEIEKKIDTALDCVNRSFNS